MIGNDDIWTAVLPGAFLNETGEYLFNWDCQGGIRGGYFNSHILVNDTGKNIGIQDVLIYAILLLTIIGVIFIANNKHGKTDFKGKREKLVSEHKSMKKTIISSVLYSIFKNSFVWNYFLGWIIIFILKDMLLMLIFSAGIYSWFITLFNIYSLGAILILVAIIALTVDIMKGVIDDISNDNWGIDNG